MKIEQGQQQTKNIHNLSNNCKNRFVAVQQRNLQSEMPTVYWDFIAQDSCYIHWNGIPIQKDPLQVVMTQQLIQELQPKTIIEFGSFKGGSALWLADIQSLSVTQGKVISIDMNLDNIYEKVKYDTRIEFLQGDCNKIEEIFTISKLQNLLHPILLIEDAHVNTVGILDYFHAHSFKHGDYFIIEDTNINYNNACYRVWQKELEEHICLEKLENLNDKINKLNNWLTDKNEMYLIDQKYVDPFGIKNATKNWNSVLKRVYD